MARHIIAVLVVALVVGLPAPRAHGATPDQVDAAIKKAKKFIRSQQKKDGSWPETAAESQYGGVSAMGTYALLAGGDSPQDEHIKRAVQWLANTKITGIYALGLRAQVWPYLKMDKDVRAAVNNDFKLLLDSTQPGTGRWGYTTAHGGEHNSPTQYGVLGLWACARTGIEVPTKFWQESEKGWLDCQGEDGGWQYMSARPEKGKSSATMTAAGLASLFIAQDYLRANDGIRCNGNVSNPNIDAGMRWMSNNFPAGSNNGYLLYGIERIGVASGYKYFGKNDWYASGSDTLVKSQGADGSFPGGFGPIPETAFGIFFLARGRAPIVMNKLEYEFDVDPKKKHTAKDIANWNQRPRDAANAVRWMGTHMERDLNWQIVNLKVGAADLLDAPILYIAGDQLLRLNDDDKQKLKSYVEQGGVILGQADCGKADFNKSFHALGKELFPAYDFRQLLPAHPVFNEQFTAAKWKDKIDVEGLSNGVRELMLLIPKEDVARSWQTQTYTKNHHFELLSNIFLYAVDKSNLRYKGETYVIKPDPAATPRKTVKVARIQYAGNWDPEPGGWQRLHASMLNTFHLGLKVDTVRPGGGGEANVAASKEKSGNKGRERDQQPHVLGAAAPREKGSGGGNAKGKTAEAKPAATSLKGYEVAHLTGTDAFELSAAARDDIRDFVEAGGTLLVDAAGGNTAFAESAEAELAKMFKDAPDQLEQPLKQSDPIYTMEASKLNDVSYRNFAKEKLGKALKSPRLRAIKVKDREAVFYSKEDLTTGLVGQPVDGVFGYDPKSATQLVTNVILLATGETTAAATQPTTAPAPPPAPAATPPAPAPTPAPAMEKPAAGKPVKPAAKNSKDADKKDNKAKPPAKAKAAKP